MTEIDTKEKKRETSRQWYLANKEKIKEERNVRTASYYAAHREEILAKAKERYKKKTENKVYL